MKRLLSLLLSVAMIITMLSVLGVVASAEDEPDTDIGTEVLPEGGDVTDDGDAEEGDDTTGDDTTEGEEPEVNEPDDGEEEIIPDPEESLAAIEFAPADAEDYRIYKYSGGSFFWEYDEGADTYGFVYKYHSLEGLYIEGNQLIVTDEDGTETVYTCNEELSFVAESGECLEGTSLGQAIEENEDGVLTLYVKYGDLSCQYSYEYMESDIASIAPLNNEPVLLDAYRDGYYGRLSAGENKGDLTFFYDTTYDKDFTLVLTYKDGTERLVSVADDEALVLAIAEKNEQKYTQWMPGEVYYVECYLEGVSFEIAYEISENTVASVDYVQLGSADVLYKGADGYYTSCDHEECGYTYFEFNQMKVFPADGDVITVTYTDGTVESLRWENRWLIGADGTYYNDYIVLYDNQADDHWSVGECTFYIRLFGYEDTVKVQVADREVIGIEAGTTELVQLYENTHGHWVGQGADEKYIYRYSEYEELLYFTVYYSVGNPDYFYYDADKDYFYNEYGERFPYTFYSDDNQLEEPWEIGTQSVTIYVGGFEAVVSGEIIENPVESIDAIVSDTPVFNFEDPTQGYWYPVGEGDEYEEWFIYDFDLLASCLVDSRIIVYYKDGTVKEYSYNEEYGFFLDAEGRLLPEIYSLSYREYQTTNKWTPDGDNYFIVEYMGARDKVSVVIDNGGKPSAAKLQSVENAENGVALTWSKVNNAEEYLIYRRLEKADGKASNNPWVLVGTTNELSFVDTYELKDGAYYKYHIHTRNANGQSAYNGAVTLSGRYIAPVKGFSVTNTKSGVLFSWQKVSGYKIRFYRLEQGASAWVYLGEKNSDSANIYNTTAKSGKTYMYAAVYYVNGVASEIVYSDYITYLSQPQLKTIKNAVTGIYFNWTSVEGAVGYRVYRRAAGEKYFTYLGTTTNLWYCDNAVQYSNGTYYKYTVKAIAADGSMSSYEDGLLLRRLVMPYIQSLTNTADGITVKWAEIPGATSYRIYRRGAGQTTWTYITAVSDALSYTDTAVKDATGSYYRYTIKAVVNGVFTDYNPDGPYTMRVATPVLSGASVVEDGISVKWNAIKGAQGYNVYRKTADTEWELIDTVSGVSYIDKDAPAGVECTYTVQAYKGGYKGSYDAVGVTAYIDIIE